MIFLVKLKIFDVHPIPGAFFRCRNAAEPGASRLIGIPSPPFGGSGTAPAKAAFAATVFF